MEKSRSKTDDVTPDNLAKRLFVLTALGVLAYIGVVVALMMTAG